MSALKLIDVEAEYKSNSKLKQEDIKVLREYVTDTFQNSEISERQLYLCLHSCYYDVEKAKRTVNYYLTYRSRWTNMFTTTNPILEPQNTQLNITYCISSGTASAGKPHIDENSGFVWQDSGNIMLVLLSKLETCQEVTIMTKSFSYEGKMETRRLFVTIMLESFFLTPSIWPLPNLTNEGYKIIYVGLVTPDTSTFDMDEQMKLFFSVTDLYLAMYGNSEGIAFIVDINGFSWKHLTKLKLSSAKRLTQYVQDAFPIRLKQIHLINSWAVVDKLLTIAKIFMSTEFYELIHVHTNLETVYKYIPKSYLPEDYGGSEVNVPVMHKNMLELLMDNSSFFQ